MDNEMITNLEAYFDVIKTDYANWTDLTNPVCQEMYKEFCEGLTYEKGSKYLKIVKKSGSGSSVHSFICLKDNGKFKAGDILMAASWNAPARNFARGNLFDKTFDRVRWTGAM